MESFTSELRKMAAADVLNRAKDYAEPLGFDKITPLELTESQPAHVLSSNDYYYALSSMEGGGYCDRMSASYRMTWLETLGG